MKVQIFNYILLGIIVFLLLILIFLLLQNQGRGKYSIGIYPDDDYIQIGQLVTFSSKKYFKNTSLSYPKDTTHPPSIFKRNSEHSQTLLWAYSDESLLYPDRIWISWLNLNERQSWYATLKLPNRYWKDMESVHLDIAFNPQGELIVYKNDEDEHRIEIGRYQAERGDNDTWTNLIHNHYAKQLTLNQQIDLCIKKYNYDVKIVKGGCPLEEIEQLTVVFYKRLVGQTQIIEETKKEWEKPEKRVLGEFRFVLDSLAYDLSLEPLSLFFALEEMEQGADLTLLLLPDEKAELKLISRRSQYEIPVEYHHLYKRETNKTENNE